MLLHVLNNKVRKPRAFNSLRSDPTRSATLRRMFLAEIQGRFNRLKREIDTLLLKDKALGLTANAFCPTGEGGGVDPTCSPGETVTVYHGTSSSFLESIKQNGLTFGKGEGADVYVKKVEGVDYALTYANVGGRKVSVYVSTDSAQASTYAFRVAKLNKAEPVILKIEVPKSSLIEDEAGGSTKSFRIEGVIHPTSIREVFKIDYDKDELVSVGQLTDNASLVKLYVCFLVAKKTATTNAEQWKYEPNPNKIELFRKWLASQVKKLIVDEDSSESYENAWWDTYIKQAYIKGIGRAFGDTKKPGQFAGDKKKMDFYKGTLKDFLSSAFGTPVHRDKVKILASRTFGDLKGVTDEMSTKMTRTLVDGIIQGKNPYAIARDMKNEVDISQSRANTIARTEITRAHGEGQLDAMVRMGITRVGVMVEFDTSNDGSVCEACAALEGVILTIEESRGLLPVHPNCRCGFSSANVGEDPEGQKRTKEDIDKAFKRAIGVMAPKKLKGDYAKQKAQSRWGGAKKTIEKARPKSLFED